MSSDGDLYNEAVVVSTKLDELRESYLSTDGSNNTSILNLRKKFSKIIPFHSRNWYRHWSEFAFDLVRKDVLAKRPVFANEGPRPTSTPRSNNDRLYIFNPSNNPEYPPDLSRPPTPATRGSSAGNPDQGAPNRPILPSGDRSMEDRLAALSRANEEAQNRIALLLGNQEKSSGKKRSHHHRDRSSSISSDSTTKSEKDNKKFAFITKKIDTVNDVAEFTPGALIFAADVKGYESSIAAAVRGFNRNGKPAHFPEVLSKELLLGKYIDLRRIKGELLNRKKGDATFMASGKEKGLEVSKFLTLEIEDLAEWEHYFRIFKRATKMAFPDCGKFISDYSKYIKSQFWSGPIRANWKNIAEYDAAFRIQVADRRYVCFSDWDHKDFDVLKTQFFGGAYNQSFSAIPIASTSYSRPSVQTPFRRKAVPQAGLQSSKPVDQGSSVHYTPDFKHKSGLGITPAKGVKHSEQYCFAYNSPANFLDPTISRPLAEYPAPLFGPGRGRGALSSPFS
ncbi:hypothetical protein DFH28DRAFT_1194301 [Melampsora americana]|nr:hypothetical protein DFH28DRAFT_1194301 [Melampsora americana]